MILGWSSRLYSRGTLLQLPPCARPCLRFNKQELIFSVWVFFTATPKIKRSKGRSDTISDGGEGLSFVDVLLCIVKIEKKKKILSLFWRSCVAHFISHFVLLYQIFWKVLMWTRKDLPRSSPSIFYHLWVRIILNPCVNNEKDCLEIRKVKDLRSLPSIVCQYGVNLRGFLIV